jgi:integrase
VKGEQVQFETYRYELRSYEGSKVVYKAIGTDAQKALQMSEREQRRRVVRAEAEAVGEKIVEEEARKLLTSAAKQYVKRAEENQAREAAIVYGKALEHFLEDIRARYVDEVDEDVMRAFHVRLRKRGNGPRTIANKHSHVKGFLVWAGADPKKLGRKPRFEKKIPIVYDDAEIGTLRAFIKRQAFRVVIDVFRMAGLRDREAQYLTWPDVDFKRGLILVRSKPKLGFEIKDKEERDVPLVPALAAVLSQWKEQQEPKSEFVLATSSGKVNKKWLATLKVAARRAGLNCGRCDSCRERNECARYTLHSFRRTYATTLSRNGVDVRTIMQLMGHSDIQTTLSYLAPMTMESAQTVVNKIVWPASDSQVAAVPEDHGAGA